MVSWSDLHCIKVDASGVLLGVSVLLGHGFWADVLIGLGQVFRSGVRVKGSVYCAG